MIRYALSLVFLATFTACSNVAPTENRDMDTQAIKDTEAAWVKDIATKDPENWAQHYANDAALSINGMPVIVGKDNIRAAIKPFVADANFALTFTSTKVEVARSGDIGYSRGAYSMTMTDPKTKQPFTDHGKYVTIFRKAADGKWLAIEDTSSSDQPPPGEAH